MTELPDELLSARFVWLRRNGVVPPLLCPYDGPYAVLWRGPCFFTIRIGSQGRDHLCQPLQGLQGSGRHTRQSVTPRPTTVQVPKRSHRHQAGLFFRPTGLLIYLSSGTVK